MTGFSLLLLVALVLGRPAPGDAQQRDVDVQAPGPAQTRERAGSPDDESASDPRELQGAELQGGEPPQPPELAPIVIDAERRGESALVERSFDTAEDVSGFGETIFAEPTWRSFETTAELLGQSVGAQLRRQGGRDDFATLSIRGAPSGQVKILLDGVSLGRASDSVVNLADLPLDTIERIEVYRGFAPVGLSPASAGGVVNVITRDPATATASAAVGAGSFGTAKVNAGGAGPLAGGNAAAFASYRTTDGDFAYRNDSGTPPSDNKADDFVDKRANNDSDAVESLVRWRRDVGASSRIQLRNHTFYKEEGVPGFQPPKVEGKERSLPTARLETVREIGAVAVGAADGRWNVEQNVTWESKKLRKSDVYADNTGETTATTTAARWARPIGKTHWFSASGDYTWEGFEQRFTAAASPKQEADRSSLAIAAGDDWTIEALATTLSFQLRHQQLWNDDRAMPDGGNTSAQSTDPRAGLRWQPFAGFAIKSNVSSYFRPPTFDEMFGTDGFTVGNPDLKPEQGLAWDAGFEWTAERAPYGNLRLGYAYFGSDIDDVILVRLTFDRSAKAFNETRAQIRGHEARLEWQGPFGVALSANSTFQDAENRSKSDELRGKDLAGLPPQEAWARLSWTHGLFVVAYDIDVAAKHYNDPENHDEIPARTVHGLSAVLGPFGEGFRVTLEANNLGDSLVPDEIGFPLPGRSFFATLSWSMMPKDAVAGAR